MPSIHEMRLRNQRVGLMRQLGEMATDPAVRRWFAYAALAAAAGYGFCLLPNQ